MSLLIDNIGQLSTCDKRRRVINNAAVVCDDDTITWVGETATAPACDERLDVDGRAVIPGFVDSHSHLIFAGDRSSEFAARMAGKPYRAGGIRSTVATVQSSSDDILRANVAKLTTEMYSQGTTTIEIKSGYGLTIADEVRALKIAQEFTNETTYLGAHVVPTDTDADTYTELAATTMLDACAPYAKWADVFCEKGAFTVDQARTILTAAKQRGLGIRVHGNQLGHSGGVALAVELEAASVDHCTYLSDADVDALASSQTVATLLPGVEFSTRSPYPDAKRLISAGATVALASDCNPGSCFSSSMPLMIALAVRDMGMTVEQALWSATAGGAQALRRDDIGIIEVGRQADLVVLDAPSYEHLAYRPGVPLTWAVVQGGVTR